MHAHPHVKIIRHTDRDFPQHLERLNRHATPPKGMSEKVSAILQLVHLDGDAGLIELCERFDQVKLTQQTLALKSKPKDPAPDVAKALKASLDNIHHFSKQRLPKSWTKKNKEGATVGEQYLPFDRVGVYVPGGTAPLISTALMTVGIAQVAGVKEIVVTTPPPVHPTLYYALKLAGATEVYQVGGAQAIGALAYGTETIRRVQKIFGPGNAFVVEAKRQVMGTVAIDLLPGPSEIAIVADESAKPAFAAADLLAQAEHGHNSQAVFITHDAKVLEAVHKEIDAQLPQLSRQKFLVEVMKTGFSLILAKSPEQALAIAEIYAPEHLTLMIKNARKIAASIRNSGAIFIGNHSPVAAGDFIAGPSHTLPTGGSAKSFAGLTVDQFYKRTSIVEYTPAAIKKVAGMISTIATEERLDAHAKSALIRK